MATNKLSIKFRSITYPNSESSSQKKQRGRLQRMPSFDFTVNESAASSAAAKASSTRREVSAEGRIRTKQFQHTHSSASSLAPGQKMLRFSDECWYSPPGEHSGRPHASSVSCLTSPKSKPGSAIRLNVNSNVERLVDWSRQSPEKHSVSPNSSQDLGHRHSRSKERRTDRDSTNERRSHYGTSISLPPPAKCSVQSSTETPPTTPAVTTPEARGRRSQFRRAWSLFSLACDKEVERERREKSPQQKILRPPTRHFYRRGLSGLPIECSTRYLGLAY
ncbi:uncharacterized protein LOC123518611 [Portunus trituberculatus]|uniref:Uncharacterized protein n=1 Tax=Portunus trituberculatus TaxID=210409 RepID=A0A5B7HD03_PORTR|nr:uncharacterized protein LOC123518611 [Portunus trituberculatus]MPC70190.1 hypothetical protein [Portunus trituberculatus]